LYSEIVVQGLKSSAKRFEFLPGGGGLSRTGHFEVPGQLQDVFSALALPGENSCPPGQTAQDVSASNRAGLFLAEGVRGVEDGHHRLLLRGARSLIRGKGSEQDEEQEWKPEVSHHSFKYSLRSFPTLKKGRRLGWTLTISPVLGLRP